MFSGEQSEPSLSDSWSSLQSNFFPPDLVNLPIVSAQQPSPKVPRYKLTALMPVTETSKSSVKLSFFLLNYK